MSNEAEIRDHTSKCAELGAGVLEQVNRYNLQRQAIGLEPCVYVLLMWPNNVSDESGHVASSSNASELKKLARVLKYVSTLWSQGRGLIRGIA